jgi:hypothetical protein
MMLAFEEKHPITSNQIQLCEFQLCIVFFEKEILFHTLSFHFIMQLRELICRTEEKLRPIFSGGNSVVSLLPMLLN